MEKIILYSTGCPQCDRLKERLDEYHIEYEVSDDILEMAFLGIKTVPVLSVDGQLLKMKDALVWVKGRG